MSAATARPRLTTRSSMATPGPSQSANANASRPSQLARAGAKIGGASSAPRVAESTPTSAKVADTSSRAAAVPQAQDAVPASAAAVSVATASAALASAVAASAAPASAAAAPAAPASAAPAAATEFTLQDLAKHKKFTAINGKVYDLTNFKHPGGPFTIAAVMGKDGTSEFKAKHGAKMEKNLKQKGIKLVGVLVK